MRLLCMYTFTRNHVFFCLEGRCYLLRQRIGLDSFRLEKCPDIYTESISETFQRIHSDISFPSLYA